MTHADALAADWTAFAREKVLIYTVLRGSTLLYKL